MSEVESKGRRIDDKGPIDIGSWLESITRGRPVPEAELIRHACEFAQTAHAGQTRASGEPYIRHSIAVAQILADLRLDHEAISAAILHDVVEDTDVSLEDITEKFGSRVAHLVDGVTKMDLIEELPDRPGANRKERAQAESLRKMLLAMAEDIRVVLIKFADRLHNMRTLKSLPDDKQQRIARETMELFAPLANRLGIWQVKWELEDLAFSYLESDAYKQIVARLAERRADRERYINSFVELLKKELKDADVEAEVTGRVKHIYGIWRKMRRKNQDFDQIYDVRAVRILVKDVPDCYAALGVVHTCWQFVPGEFDDYIATPKENNYQSIHTAVIGAEGKTVEVQIRTYDMQQQAELGVAAHWRYKEGAKKRDQAFDNKIAWLRQLMEWKDEVAEASDFVDHFKSEVFSDRIYVFTPKGNVVDLPRGATPLDFAYHIHTEVGHCCRGAKVNGHIVPLTYELKTGEQVAVLTVKKGTPSRDWLNPNLGYLTTSRARGKVQHWFRQQNYDESVATGRTSLERELHRLGLAEVNYEKLASELGFGKVDDFFASIGRGETRTSQIINAVQEVAPKETVDELLPTARSRRLADKAAAINIQGVGNLLTHMAQCCKPVPGDSILGFITSGRGVTIHRRDCPNVLRYYSEGDERLVEVNWGAETDSTYPVDIEISVYDRQGLLRDIAAVLANEKINVMSVNTLPDKHGKMARMQLTLEIPDIDTLSRVLTQIDRLPNVRGVRRKLR